MSMYKQLDDACFDAAIDMIDSIILDKDEVFLYVTENGYFDEFIDFNEDDDSAQEVAEIEDRIKHYLCKARDHLLVSGLRGIR